jgi:hypothetical protein
MVLTFQPLDFPYFDNMLVDLLKAISGRFGAAESYDHTSWKSWQR